MDLPGLLHKVSATAEALTPSLIGSAVAQAWKPGLLWRQRFLQWVVGSTVSFYATRIIIELTGWNSFIAQSIAFGIALIAFDATPRLMAATSAMLASLPERLADLFFRKGDH